jgi:type VI secretion system protein ImpE
MWVPFTNISRMVIEAPEDVRDVVWIPAHIQWKTEGESFVLIPTRYPFSYTQDDALALSRKTEWNQKGAEMYIGYGQRLLVTDALDYSILDIRELSLNSDEL